MHLSSSKLAASLIAIFICAPASTGKELWGYLDQKGKVVIKPQFADARPFMHGFAKVWNYYDETNKTDWSHCVFVDKSGRQYNSAVKVGEDAYEHYTDDGRQILQDTFTAILSSRGRLMLLKRQYDLTVADASGHIVAQVPPEWIPQGLNPKTGNFWCRFNKTDYEFTGPIKQGLVPGFEAAGTPKKLPPSYDYVEEFSEGLAAAMTKDGHWAYIDSDGKVQIELPKDCSNAQRFSEGLAAVSIGGKPWSTSGPHARTSAYNGAKFGFINKSGKFVIPPKFPCPYKAWSSQFKNGLALATREKNGDTAYGYIGRKGAFVVKPIYRAVAAFNDGLAAFDSGPVGFDKDRWTQGSYSRVYLISTFLREFDFIGMPRPQVFELLGKPDGIIPITSYDYYSLEGGCLGATQCTVQYKNDRVSAYHIGSSWDFTPGRPPVSWMTSNAKPEFEEDLTAFCAAHAGESPAQ